MAGQVHHLDGYPAYLPDGDLPGFLVSDDALGAWVMELDGDVVGHVALHPRTSRPVLELASTSLRLPAERLAVIARLLVAPDARRRGIGRALLDVAAGEARSRGLWPVLDVLTDSAAAIALYEDCGWERAGDVRVSFRDGTTFEEAVFLGPGRRR
jgi:GNAT superfamily N-acetyltransferase